MFLSLFILTALPLDARGSPSPQVLVTTPDMTNEVFVAVARELRISGFEVIEARLEARNETMFALEEFALKEGAVAAIRVNAPTGRVEIVVADLVTGKTVARRLDNATGAEIDPPLIGLATAELLRASLLEIRERHRSIPAISEVPVAVKALVDPGSERAPANPLWLSLSAGSTISSLGMAPGIALEGVLRLEFHRLWSTALFASAPVYASEGRWEEGSVETRHGIFGGEAALGLVGNDRSSPARWDLGLGAAVVFVKSTGKARAEYVGSENNTTTAMARLRTGICFRLSRYLGLRLDLAGGPTFSRVKIAVAGRDKATLASVFTATAGLDIRIFGGR